MSDEVFSAEETSRIAGDLIIQSSDLSLMNIAELAETGALDLSPKFQRRNRWNRERQSKLIESFIINAPIPPVYLAEESQGRYSVIDGKQRLTAIAGYLRDEFVLTGLTFLPTLDGYSFKELPIDIQSTLKMRPLRCVIILRQTVEWMKYEVFLRLNTGGQPLNAQELRNVAFAGPLNEKLIDLSENSFLKQQLKIKSSSSSAYAEMNDVEYVLRYFAVSENWRHFSGSLGGTMDFFMRDNTNITFEKLKSFEKRFNRSLNACEEVWGEHAFHRWDPGQEQWRNQLIGGMYDAQMVAIGLLNEEELNTVKFKKEIVLEKTKSLFAEDLDFVESVRIGTNTPKKLRYRIDVVYKMLSGLE